MIKFATTLFILLFSVLVPSAGFSEELLNALNKAGTVFGTLRLQSGKQADVSLAFYAQDQQTYYSIYGAGITCEGSLTLVSSAGNSLLYSMQPSSNEVPECPESGGWNISGLTKENKFDILISSPSGDVRGSMDFNKMADEILVEEDIPIIPNADQIIEQGLIQKNPCENFDWDGVAYNVIDLFECDEGRAMNTLTTGMPIQFEIQKVTLRDGWIYLSNFTRGSYIDDVAKRMAVENEDGWDEWNLVTGAKTYEVICLRLPSSQIQFNVGDIFKGRGKLTQRERLLIVMDCR